MRKSRGRPTRGDWTGSPVPQPRSRKAKPNVFKPNFLGVAFGILEAAIVMGRHDPRHPEHATWLAEQRTAKPE